jgi:hypothetical protein
LKETDMLNHNEPVLFEALGPMGDVMCYYTVEGHRAPRSGEWYLSGAIPMAYKARRDMASAYTIVTPTHYAAPRRGYEIGPKVKV